MLNNIDPLFYVPSWQLMLVAGGVECVIACYCFLKSTATTALGLVAWCAAAFLTYRFGLWWLGWRSPCQCFGSLFDAVGLSPNVQKWTMWLMLAYLGVGSCSMLGVDYLSRRLLPDRAGVGEVAGGRGNSHRVCSKGAG